MTYDISTDSSVQGDYRCHDEIKLTNFVRVDFFIPKGPSNGLSVGDSLPAKIGDPQIKIVSLI